MKTLGLCAGASSISVVGLESKNGTISQIEQQTIYHDGDSKGSIEKILKTIAVKQYDRICVTGRKFRKFINLTSITEPEAVEYSIDQLIAEKEKYNALISAGGETIIVYELSREGKIYNVFTGNKCASGTGEFFVQQLGRMALSISDLKQGYTEEDAYDISGRCSVFCKSDCTHALNKGVLKDRVVAGLCKMMAIKMTELLSSLDQKNVILSGGLSRIKPIVQFVESAVDSLIIPEQSGYFEAYGAAVWAFSNQTLPFPGFERLFKEEESSFDFLNPLSKSEALVEFKTINTDQAQAGDVCILGVDIGSTTTKAVLMRKSDDAILASVYLRTEGDPIGAARKCYQAVEKQLSGKKVKIIGLGTTGSGRQIVGLHALTESIYNEIICHATASIYFDEEVDTIFEIGGQDAKYTYITQGIPSDYAMNEACSAGTGSFLEEAAKESLNVSVEDIAPIALTSQKPPNFNDQCSAFISSDIATAFQEGIKKNDIVSGLVYSICQNYNNRVRGARPYGKKVFMQGGVCYNKAVPIAMASLLQTKIIVPPEPGLMGAFGCAYEIKKRLEKNLLTEKEFDLKELFEREIRYGKSFICRGGKEKCDRKCTINMIEIGNEKFPFGGACNKYYNIRYQIEDHSDELDFVAIRNKLIFEEFAVESGRVKPDAPTIGINRTFLTNMLYPLYFNFWDQLGYKVVLSDDVTDGGREKRKAAFCYPAEIAHGAFDNLLSKNCDYLFMPHIMHIPVSGSRENNKACVFVQGEPYYLKEAFKDRGHIPPMLVPVVDFQQHVDSTEKEFVKCAVSIGANKAAAEQAFRYAADRMTGYFRKAWQIGQKFLDDLAKDRNKMAIVLMGRWYNALAKEANMSIPHKFASRGIPVLPFDFIPFNYENLGLHMHWGIGKIALQVARYVKKHPQLFATYITNFSCGPDSFVIPYFRDEMGKKPSLTLELDSHTADVGLNTRIEAAIDIIQYYRQLSLKDETETDDFKPAETIYRGTNVYIKDSSGKEHHIKDKNVTFLFPRMGTFLTEAGIAALKGDGFHSAMVDQPNVESLGVGKGNSSCKECLPYIVLVGSLLEYIRTRKRPGEIIAYFIVGDPAPCRVEQYQVGFKKIIQKLKLKDVAVITLESAEGFSGMGFKPLLNVWTAFCLADVMEQIHSSILTLAKDREKALKIFFDQWQKILLNFEGKEKKSIYKRMQLAANELSKIELKYALEDAHRITVTGEMYVRNEVFCRQFLENTLADMGFITKITPLIEWHYYVDYAQWKNWGNEKFSIFKRIFFFMKRKVQINIERKIKRIFDSTPLYEYDPINIEKILNTSNPLVNPKLIGDIGITIGVGLTDLLKDSCGIISLGPFACIQTRMAEAILNNNMTVGHKLKVNRESVFGDNIQHLDENMPLPYLAIESDGNPYPQIVEARLEVFGLQARRIGALMNQSRKLSN